MKNNQFPSNASVPIRAFSQGQSQPQHVSYSTDDPAPSLLCMFAGIAA